MKKRTLIAFTTAAVFFCGSGLGMAADDSLLLKNGNILTVSDDAIENGDILIAGGKIIKVGKDLEAKEGAKIVDLDGRWVMPGIIDSHSHIAIDGGVNEMGNLMTPEVDIKDVIYPEDINIFYALTGGVTTIHTMHGSANPIGGRGIVLKLRWGKSAEEMIFQGAPPTLKWALGENPKQSNMNIPGQSRYPKTRMGVEASIRLEFEKAKDYKRKWKEYEMQVDQATAAHRSYPFWILIQEDGRPAAGKPALVIVLENKVGLVDARLGPHVLAGPVRDLDRHRHPLQ